MASGSITWCENSGFEESGDNEIKSKSSIWLAIGHGQWVSLGLLFNQVEINLPT